jgi:CheY-like chemotaxis protein
MNSNEEKQNTVSSPAPRPSKRILVVDDNKELADVFAKVLRKLGQEVMVGYDGQFALEATLTFGPDIIFMDIAMPNMDGYETVKKLKQKPGCGRAKVIALTGYGQKEDRQRSFEAGFDAHLVKPISIGDIERILSTQTDQARAEAA